VFGEKGSLFVRINSLFGCLGNSPRRLADFKGLAIPFGLQAAAKAGISQYLPVDQGSTSPVALLALRPAH